MLKENNLKSIDSTSTISHKKPKCKEIYELIEESSSDEDTPVTYTKKEKKANPSKALKLFEGRNEIKKVKTYCLKAFYRAMKECADLKETLVSTYRLKIYEKRQIYKTFKSDISKFRNKVLLNLKMRKIMKIFSNININDKSKIRPNKWVVYNFLMNSEWYEIINYVKRGNKEIVKLTHLANDDAEVTISEVNNYLEYINSGSIIYKERINLDRNYLSFFEEIIGEFKNDKEKKENEKKIVDTFMKTFEGFN